MSRHCEIREDAKVVVAIDKDKGSQFALKWTVDHVLNRGDTVTLIHVKQKPSSIPTPNGSSVSITEVNDEVAKAVRQQIDSEAKEIFLPFRCFCTRKEIKTDEIILESNDVGKSIIEFTTNYKCENLVLGATSRNGLVRRFKGPDVPSVVSKGAAEFTTVYVICKGKIQSVRCATRPRPTRSHAGSPKELAQQRLRSSPRSQAMKADSIQRGAERSGLKLSSIRPGEESMKSPLTRGRAANGRSYGEISTPTELDISFVGGSSRLSLEAIKYGPSLVPQDIMDSGQSPRLSGSSSDLDRISFGSSSTGGGSRPFEMNVITETSSSGSPNSSNCSGFSVAANMEDMEGQMWRLRQELKQTMEMYNNACKEALTARQRAQELQVLKMEEKKMLEEARQAEENALAMVEKEKQKSRAALQAAEAAQRLAEMEAQKRMSAELKALREAEEKRQALEDLIRSAAAHGVVGGGDFRYRRYSIDEIEVATDYFLESRIIGEGGYGPVYKGTLDHTPVAIKVLRPDAAQGHDQFQQEVEILSCIRHPNMVILLGACPEYGCLVYEYMSNGSLEDRLYRRNNTAPLPWQIRFRIAAEIGTALNFLHHTKPEPLVHRDLKPANILIDRNFVSKISDVGLARLVPASMADTITQYRMTSTAGTFCYIDPEYQQTGMLGVKSDVYSLGVLLLQLVTARPPMGLTHLVERALERGEVAEVLDPAVEDWPVREVTEFVRMALRCAELRRKDRPDLGKEVLPLLKRMRELAEGNMMPSIVGFHKSNHANTTSGPPSTSTSTAASSLELRPSGESTSTTDNEE